MEQQPLISIALCTYNGKPFLQQQLDSILNQTYQNTELIIVDDCSTDGTYSILETYANKHPRIRLYKNSSNLGFIKNFERAIENCRGPLIALSDQDDIWLPDKLKLQAVAIRDNLLIYHNSEFITEDGSSMHKHISDVRNFYKGNDNRVFLIENCVSGHSCLFKRELIRYLLPFPAHVFHDWWMAFIATSYGSIDFLSESLVKYRQHSAANTDILRAGPGSRRNPLREIQKETERIDTFLAASPPNADISAFSTMLRKRLSSYFCFSLFAFTVKKQPVLLFIQKKGKLSKLNFSLKYFWGYRLKKLLNS